SNGCPAKSRLASWLSADEQRDDSNQRAGTHRAPEGIAHDCRVNSSLPELHIVQPERCIGCIANAESIELPLVVEWWGTGRSCLKKDCAASGDCSIRRFHDDWRTVRSQSQAVIAPNRKRHRVGESGRC